MTTSNTSTTESTSRLQMETNPNKVSSVMQVAARAEKQRLVFYVVLKS